MAKSKNENIVKGKTRSGISFFIDKRIKQDARFLLYLSRLQKKDADVSVQSQALIDILELFFGSEDNLQTFMNEVAAKHDGVADVKSLVDELSDILAALEVKNS